jgi:hypothetical protein
MARKKKSDITFLPFEEKAVGGRFFSVNRAADFLKLTPSTVYGLIRQGKLFAQRENDNYFLERADLEAYKFGTNNRKYGNILINKETISNLLGKVHKLTARISVLEHLLDCYYEPLYVTDEQLLALYNEMKTCTIDDTKDIFYWTEIINRISYENLITLSKYLDKSFWRDILVFANLITLCTNRTAFEHRTRAVKGLENLKKTILLYLQMCDSFKEQEASLEISNAVLYDRYYELREKFEVLKVIDKKVKLKAKPRRVPRVRNEKGELVPRSEVKKAKKTKIGQKFGIIDLEGGFNGRHTSDSSTD